MGDYKYSNAPSMSSISTETYVINTSSSVFYSSGATEATAKFNNTIKMQDDCLLEQKNNVKSQQQTPPGVSSAVAESAEEQPTQHHLPHDDENKTAVGVNGDSGTTCPPGSITNQSPSGLGPSGSAALPSAAAMAAAAGASAGVGIVGAGSSGLEPSVLPTSLSSNVASLWSSNPVEDSLMHSGLPAMPNGSLQFPGLGPAGAPGNSGPSPLFSSSIGPQLNLGPSAGPQGGPQRRNLQQPTGAPSFPSRPGPGPNPQGPFLTNKSYSSSWSSGLGTQGSAWSPGPSQGSGGGGPGGPSTAPGAPSMAGVGSWPGTRARAGVGQVSPLGPNIGRVSSSVRNSAKLPNTSAMLINKYQRSTSYPGKGHFPQPPTFEITGVDDNSFPRDLLPFQVS